MLAFGTDVRPTPTQKNGNADAMRDVPQYEPRTIVSNPVTRWEQLATEIGAPSMAIACVNDGTPLHYAPSAIAQISRTAGLQGDTAHRTVRTHGVPALVRGTMQGFLGRGLGDDSSFTAGTPMETTSYADYSNDLIPPSDFSGFSSEPLILLPGSAYPTAAELTPSYESYSQQLFLPPTTSTPARSSGTASAITAAGSTANNLLRTSLTPGATALTAQQRAAAVAAQNPLNQVVPGINMTVGTMLLIGGVIIGGALLVSKIR